MQGRLCTVGIVELFWLKSSGKEADESHKVETKELSCTLINQNNELKETKTLNGLKDTEELSNIALLCGT